VSVAAAGYLQKKKGGGKWKEQFRFLPSADRVSRPPFPEEEKEKKKVPVTRSLRNFADNAWQKGGQREKKRGKKKETKRL